MKIKFTKMQGIGNDYLYVNCLDKDLNLDWPELSRKMSRRHFGIGSDGIILVLHSKKADYKMRIFNSDGSEAEMCGNGIRGFVKYLYDRNIISNKVVDIETMAGIKKVEITKIENGKAKMLKVNMGKPILEAKDIPVKGKGQIINQELELKNKRVNITCVSMGNPHCIVFVDSFSFPLEKTGSEIENHKIFPNRTNVEFIQIVNDTEINMQVWERGSGVTLACGTGACAAVVASILNNKTKRIVQVHLQGGDLQIEWANDNNVYMEGSSEEVFDGGYEIK